MTFTRARRLIIVAALVVCVVDAGGSALLAPIGDPPRMAAYDVVPVRRTPPAPLASTSFPTYAPIPHLTPAEPEVTAPSTAATVPVTAPTPAPEATPAPTTAPSKGGDAPTGGPEPIPASTATVARVVQDRVVVFDAPLGRALYSLLRVDELGQPRVLLTTAQQDGWLQVQLPLPPNGSSAWIRENDVELFTVADRIDVSLERRTLRWSRDGVVLLDASVAIGAPASPTPAHSYYVTDVLPADPAGPYGAWILALNGYSESFATFNGGLPRLGIHGTNDPGSIGAAASNGCLRAGTDDLARLAAGVPVGTPVIVS